jgi:hypothetical protein
MADVADNSMLFALAASAFLGLALGLRCRVIAVIVISAGVAAAVGALAIHRDWQVLEAAGWGVLALIVVQASYLAGAALRVSGLSARFHRRVAKLLSSVPLTRM